jgi:hypothetical protein
MPGSIFGIPLSPPLPSDAVDQADGLDDPFRGRVEVVQTGDLRIGRFEPECEDVAGRAGVREDADDLLRFFGIARDHIWVGIVHADVIKI